MSATRSLSKPILHRQCSSELQALCCRTHLGNLERAQQPCFFLQLQKTEGECWPMSVDGQALEGFGCVRSWALSGGHPSPTVWGPTRRAPYCWALHFWKLARKHKDPTNQDLKTPPPVCKLLLETHVWRGRLLCSGNFVVSSCTQLRHEVSGLGSSAPMACKTAWRRQWEQKASECAHFPRRCISGPRAPELEASFIYVSFQAQIDHPSICAALSCPQRSIQACLAQQTSDESTVDAGPLGSVLAHQGLLVCLLGRLPLAWAHVGCRTNLESVS